MAQIPQQSHRPVAPRIDRGGGAFHHRGDDPQTAPSKSVRTHAVGRIVVLDVAGRLNDVVEDLDLATRLALAQGPHAVACDLSRVIEVNTTGALRMLAAVGRHPRDWPGAPVAIVGLDPRAAQTLSGKPLGGHLMVSACLGQALSSLFQAASPVAESLHLTAHPTTPRASRDFVSRTLLDWRMNHYIAPAALVVSELVMNAITHAETDIDVSVSMHRRTIRVAVRDHSPRPPVERHGGDAGRGLAIVTGLASAWGVLPTAAGGKVVWAVLDGLHRPDQMTGTRSTLSVAKAPR
jgi:signal transduction histidine kinase